MAKIYVSELDAKPYYDYYMNCHNKYSIMVEWAKRIITGREEYAAKQISRLKGAVAAYRQGARPQPPGLEVEGIAALILFWAGDPEVIIEGLPREDLTVLPGKLIVHVERVKGGKKWVYRFSPPTSAKGTGGEAPTSAPASVGSRARVKRAR